MYKSSIAIVGAGIVGCAIAYELSNNGYKNITVIEKNATILGPNQSLTNEGTIHSGIYYPKDIMPFKASLCAKGNSLMYEFLEKHNLPHKKVGKLIIATNKKEEEYLDFFLKIGVENGVPGIKKITGKKAKKMEPNIANIASALYIPSAGSASPQMLIEKVKTLAEANGVSFIFNTKVSKMTPDKKGFLINDNIQADIIINSAGLFADEIARLIDPGFPYEITPTRGEFFQFDKSKRQNIWMNGMHVYQPPYCYEIIDGKMNILSISPKELNKRLEGGSAFITAGVHLSPAYEKINGNYVLKNKITISPLKTTGLGKEDYTTNTHKASDYIKKINYFFPNLKKEDLVPDHTGIMSPLKGYRDFIIEKDKKFPNFINLVGMESPAWTSSFAIAKYVSHLLRTQIKNCGTGFFYDFTRGFGCKFQRFSKNDCTLSSFWEFGSPRVNFLHPDDSDRDYGHFQFFYHKS